jgi:hypothetical protein
LFSYESSARFIVYLCTAQVTWLEFALSCGSVEFANFLQAIRDFSQFLSFIIDVLQFDCNGADVLAPFRCALMDTEQRNDK